MLWKSGIADKSVLIVEDFPTECEYDIFVIDTCFTIIPLVQPHQNLCLKVFDRVRLDHFLYQDKPCWAELIELHRFEFNSQRDFTFYSTIMFFSIF